MKVLYGTMIVALGWAAAAAAGETVAEYHWPDLKRAGRIKAGKVILAEDGAADSAFLRVENEESGKRRITLAAFSPPVIDQDTYALATRVRYHGVQGHAYLELRSRFGEEEYFTRTLTRTGPLKYLTGASPWRRAVIPFYKQRIDRAPDRLTLQIVFPGRGTVDIGALSLNVYEPDEDPLAPAGAWFGQRQAGLFGGICGALVGIVGALIGVLGGSAKARRTVFTATYALIVIGAVCLVTAVWAALAFQPAYVLYPFAILGIVCVVVPLAILPGLKKRYHSAEMQRIRTMDTA